MFEAVVECCWVQRNPKERGDLRGQGERQRKIPVSVADRSSFENSLNLFVVAAAGAVVGEGAGPRCFEVEKTGEGDIDNSSSGE